MKETTLLGEKINYTVRKSERATIPRVDVSIRGIRVVLPEGVEEDPENLLQKKAVQVVKSKKEFDDYKDKIPERRFEEGETFPLLGEDHELVVSSETEDNKIENGRMVLSAQNLKDSSIKEELENLYKKKAREIIEDILEDYQYLNVDYNKIKLKNQKTRWASCSSLKNLNFNWRIVMAPKEIIEYIVVHELVHLEEKGHSKKFWSKVASILPDYKERVKWLEEHSPKMVFSEEDY
ncbi:hypothetical protein AKJ57_03200 [candidate division MSBL1 archaeon SCGC-AAA259A05]|uniref:YgjP-like metallopeptidase domain-containing protein n=1 Tax=candidate division MSBL1 archaeon SCGC-AAA259A05 TaxID=1698259 RepID=A0A133U9M2_9EURY|nr:hypothetical protein AKJ57_03200 [candidate division MSBL1 archaeon SCGC-AAA259A05]